jgi:ribonuclease R
MVSQILALLKKNKQGLSFQKIAVKLHLLPKEKPILKRHLQKLEEQGVIVLLRRRYFFRPQSQIVRGKFITSIRDFGFVRPEEEHREDIFIPARYSGGALLGDTVEVLFKERGRKGKPEGRIFRILDKKQKRVYGLYRERMGQPFVLPFDSPSAEEILLEEAAGHGLEEGMVLAFDRESHRLERVLGKPENPGVDTQVVIHRFNLKTAFSQEAEAESEGVSSTIPDSALKERVDYRGWKTVTIDGEKAQDFDDAVSVRKLSDGRFQLGVHIADVAFYIQPGSALDREALARGTSVYFPDLTLPMFPTKIANQICSLRPREDRLTVSVLLDIDKDGSILDADFYPSVIRTEERMTYSSVFKIFAGDERERKKYSDLVPDLLLMQDLAQRLRQKRLRQGSLDFDFVEPELVYEGENLLSVMPLERNEAHQVIEEFMVAANEAVAGFLVEKNRRLIFRIHPPPSLEALTKLKEMLGHFGVSLPPASKVRSRDLQRVLERVAGRPEEKFLNLQVLKSLSLAVYAEENLGHYGLAKERYTHFTSPIRRYPDLVVHRILKSGLKGDKMKLPALDSVAQYCSEKERNAEEAEKDLMEWRIFRFLKGKLGDELEGIVVSFSKAGLVVELNDYFVDGLVPFSELGDDYYVRRSDKRIVGRRTGRMYVLGDRVRVVLAAVDSTLRRITLAFPSHKR